MTSSSKRQIPTEYKSGLPDFLLSFVDSIIKIDTSQIMRYNFLNYTIDDLLREDVPRQDVLLLFIDPEGEKHIIVENIKAHSLNFPIRKAQTFTRTHWDNQTAQAHPQLSKLLSNSQLQKLSTQRIVTIDQIRLNCLANIYFQPEELITDIKGVMAWNQVFRAKSANSFLYVSQLFERIVQIINKKKFHKKFTSIKNKDFQRLLSYELVFKANIQEWPVIPQKFRQYEEIDQYVPSVKSREQLTNHKIETKKMPIECPDDCVCFCTDQSDQRQFCKYTLKDGWVSECPNRANKIECSHSDQQKMQKCKNSQIRKNLRKKCKKEQGDSKTENQIQECIIWGIDLFTRNTIYHSLPEVDISFPEYSENKIHRSNFIEESFLKAINFNGREGYKMDKACERIMGLIQNCQNLNGQPIIKQEVSGEQMKKQQSISRKQDKNIEQIDLKVWKSINFVVKFFDSEENQQKSEKQSSQIFSERDKFYAKILNRNYKYCMNYIDKTAYRIHTKGKGARCIKKEGIKQGRFIVQYFGQLYEPWRWYQREDFIKKMINNKKMKNFIPEFYNIYLETHADDPQGYDLMVVDPIKKGNFSSRFSHSCNPNCGTVTTISNGKYYIGMYSFKDIKYGQQLTFDYCCVTESKNQHENSICLCGMQKCRGYYLQLANSKIYNSLIDKHNCFHSRSSFILKSSEQSNEEELNVDKALCAKHNIKGRMIGDAPVWIVKWIASLLRYMEQEGEIYKQQVKERLNSSEYLFQHFIIPAPNTTPNTTQSKLDAKIEEKLPILGGKSTEKQESQIAKNEKEIMEQNNIEEEVKEKSLAQIQKQQKIQLISQTGKQQLLSLRIQNLFTTVNKLKYFLNSIKDSTPPLYYLKQDQVLQYMVTDTNSVLQDIQDVFVKSQFKKEAEAINIFVKLIANAHEIKHKLFLFRLCCLYIGHQCLYLESTPRFNTTLLGDIVFFYAFTHTYFTSHQYKSHISEEIKVALQEVTGNPSDKNSEKEKKRYSSQFVWGQLAFWYKQTIVNPEASLSQDRRGTLSYPLIKTTMNSCYPYEKHCRKNFLKALREKPASSWPSAAQDGCVLSFKNPFKCYGTVFFESIHSKKVLADNLPQQYRKNNLVQNVLNIINCPFLEKLRLFKEVQKVLSGIGEDHQGYDILRTLETKYNLSFEVPLPKNILEQCGMTSTSGNKKKKPNQPIPEPEAPIISNNVIQRVQKVQLEQQMVRLNLAKITSQSRIALTLKKTE